MQAYESGNAAYFATPPVNLIYAYNASLQQITKTAPSLEERFRLHKESSQRVKKAAEELDMALDGREMEEIFNVGSSSSASS